MRWELYLASSAALKLASAGSSSGLALQARGIIRLARASSNQQERRGPQALVLTLNRRRPSRGSGAGCSAGGD